MTHLPALPTSHHTHTPCHACSDAVARCKAEIQSCLHDEETSEELECPAGIVGRIIGRGGETIRALQSASQVRCAWGPGRGACKLSQPCGAHASRHACRLHQRRRSPYGRLAVVGRHALCQPP